MKRILIFIAAAVMIFSIAGCEKQTSEAEDETTSTEETITTEDTMDETSSDYDFGAKTALEMDELTIEQMLHYALQDEYLARQEYELIINEYGEQRPFSNIILAEQAHIEWLTGIYQNYEYAMPFDNAIDYAVLPDSLEEAFDVGVQAEIDNIAMYEKFLEYDNLPDDIRAVFEELRDASKNHLAAFEKGVRGNGQGSDD